MQMRNCPDVLHDQTESYLETRTVYIYPSVIYVFSLSISTQ